MKFYNRTEELKVLNQAVEQSQQNAQMVFMVGRRRVGKTTLLLEAYKNSPCLYFFVAKKNEALLCEEFIRDVKVKLKIPVFGKIKTFKSLFAFLLNLSASRSFTLIIDEFQEFQSVNPSVFSDMQNYWDRFKNQSPLNLVLCGSVYALMTRIFENAKEPLFGRSTRRIHLKAFNTNTLKQILQDYHSYYTNEDLLAFYLFTGGIAKYVELLIHRQAFTVSAIVEEMVTENGLFIEEGKNVLIDEFGKDYGNYFSILSLIASAKTSRVEIESIMEMQTGGGCNDWKRNITLSKKCVPY